MSDVTEALTISDIQEMQGIAQIAKDAGYKKVQGDVDHIIEICRFAIERLDTRTPPQDKGGE